MEITPLVPAGRQIIETYGNGRFVIAGVAFEGSVLVFPRRTLAWPVGAIGELSKESLDEVAKAGDGVKILIIGCGARLSPVHLRYGTGCASAELSLSAWTPAPPVAPTTCFWPRNAGSPPPLSRFPKTGSGPPP